MIEEAFFCCCYCITFRPTRIEIWLIVTESGWFKLMAASLHILKVEFLLGGTLYCNIVFWPLGLAKLPVMYLKQRVRVMDCRSAAQPRRCSRSVLAPFINCAGDYFPDTTCCQAALTDIWVFSHILQHLPTSITAYTSYFVTCSHISTSFASHSFCSTVPRMQRHKHVSCSDNAWELYGLHVPVILCMLCLPVTACLYKCILLIYISTQSEMSSR